MQGIIQALFTRLNIQLAQSFRAGLSLLIPSVRKLSMGVILIVASFPFFVIGGILLLTAIFLAFAGEHQYINATLGTALTSLSVGGIMLFSGGNVLRKLGA